MIADTILQGDIRQVAQTLPAQSVHTIVTSPPYYGLRDYGVEGQIGLEASPQEYVDELVGIFRELRRVLRDDGTVWLNLGDSYASAWASGRRSVIGQPGRTNRRINIEDGLKEKDLIGIPWRVALALQADGWYLRSDIIWAKANCMPESVTDRPTKAHEYIFLLSKKARYYYDQEAIKEPVADSSLERAKYPLDSKNSGYKNDARTGTSFEKTRNGATMGEAGFVDPAGRNRRTVWTVATQPYPGAHFAVFPPDLIRPCILAGCPAKVCAECGAPWVRVVEVTGKSLPVSERHGRVGHNGQPPQISGNYWTGPTTQATDDFEPTCTCNAPTVPGVVLDPFMGSGTVAQVAIEEGRRWLGCELSQKYIDLAWKRIEAARLAKVAGKDYAKTVDEKIDEGWQQLGMMEALVAMDGLELSDQDKLEIMDELLDESGVYDDLGIGNDHE